MVADTDTKRNPGTSPAAENPPPDPGTFDAPDPIMALAPPGSLRARYFAALLRADDAARALHAAQIAGDVNARCRAEMDRWDAIGAVYKVKEEAADDFMFGFRCAMEICPGSIQQQIGTVFEALPVQADVDVLADAVAYLQAQRRAA